MRCLILSSGLLAAALVGGPQAAVAQSEGKAFCLESPTGAMNCIYDSFEECQQIKGGRTVGGCIPNPTRSGTTGAGGRNPAASPPAPLPPAGGGEYLPPPSPRAR
jgi:hypothetical protein